MSESPDLLRWKNEVWLAVVSGCIQLVAPQTKAIWIEFTLELDIVLHFYVNGDISEVKDDASFIVTETLALMQQDEIGEVDVVIHTVRSDLPKASDNGPRFRMVYAAKGI